jgi:hypothetical protein
MTRRLGTSAVLIGVLFALTAMLVPGAAGAPSQGSTKCDPHGSSTLAAGPKARVYAVDKTVYGCAYSTGKAWRLGNSSSCEGSALIEAVHVAGVLAGYGAERCGIDFGTASVIVRRVTDGKPLVDEAATLAETGAESYQVVDSLVLKADGSVAWIGVGSSIISQGKRAIEVRRVERGNETLLDSGAAIHSESLRLRGSMLTWKHGRQTRSATLS